MNILDENINESQRQLLRSWRIRVRQIGVDSSRKGIQDDEIISFLRTRQRPTFFTRDMGFYHRKFCHTRYCIVCLGVSRYEVAVFVRRVLRHPGFDTHANLNGMGGPEFFHNNQLDVALILQRFQAFMREHYSHQNEKFLERERRLLFLAFLRPILNGKGFEFKEPNVADERRMDLVITYQQHRYVVELKRWYGPKAHQEGLQQLSDYLDTYSLKQGYLLIYDFNQHKEYKQEQIVFQDKLIFAVWV